MLSLLLPLPRVTHIACIASNAANHNSVKNATSQKTSGSRPLFEDTQLPLRRPPSEVASQDPNPTTEKSAKDSGSPEEQLSSLNTLYRTLEGALKLLHPFMPFLTEEMWQYLPRRRGDSTTYVQVEDIDRSRDIISTTPVNNTDPSYNCQNWVGDALYRLMAEGMIDEETYLKAINDMCGVVAEAPDLEEEN